MTQPTDNPIDTSRPGLHVVAGVPNDAFDIHWDMHVRAAHTLLKFRGVDVSRDQVMALSGDAFHLCHASHWQGTAYLAAPHDPMRTLANALGFDYEMLTDGYARPLMRGKSMEERLQLAQRALSKIAAEIKADRPVLVGGAEDHCGTWTLAVGYDKATQSLCHVGTGCDPNQAPYRWVRIRGVAADGIDADFGVMDGRVRGTVRPGVLAGWQANAAYLFKERHGTPPTAAERVLATLRLIVRLHRAESQSRPIWGGVTYYYGAEAYEKWAEGLESLIEDRPMEQPQDAYDWFEMGNMDMQVDQIVTGRSAAARFCDEATATLPGLADDLRPAARHYRRQVAIARKAFGVFVPRFDGHDGPRVTYLADEALCHEGAEAIREMLAEERAAVNAIAKAVAALAP